MMWRTKKTSMKGSVSSLLERESLPVSESLLEDPEPRLLFHQCHGDRNKRRILSEMIIRVLCTLISKKPVRVVRRYVYVFSVISGTSREPWSRDIMNYYAHRSFPRDGKWAGESLSLGLTLPQSKWEEYMHLRRSRTASVQPTMRCRSWKDPFSFQRHQDTNINSKHYNLFMRDTSDVIYSLPLVHSGKSCLSFISFSLLYTRQITNTFGRGCGTLSDTTSSPSSPLWGWEDQDD